MINKINYSIPNYNRTAFKGKDEVKEGVKIVVDLAKDLKQESKLLSDLNSKLNDLLDKKKITKQDIGTAAQSKDLKTWIAGILAGKAGT